MKNENCAFGSKKSLLDKIVEQINSYESQISEEPTIFFMPQKNENSEKQSYTEQLECLNEGHDILSKINVLSSLKYPYQILSSASKNEECKDQKLNMYEIIEKSVKSLDEDEIKDMLPRNFGQ